MKLDWSGGAGGGSVTGAGLRFRRFRGARRWRFVVVMLAVGSLVASKGGFSSSSSSCLFSDAGPVGVCWTWLSRWDLGCPARRRLCSRLCLLLLVVGGRWRKRNVVVSVFCLCWCSTCGLVGMWGMDFSGVCSFFVGRLGSFCVVCWLSFREPGIP